MKKPDTRLNQRLWLLTLTAWMSVCMIISGFFPLVTLKLQNLWALSGCFGLVASFGLVHRIKREWMAQQQLIDSIQNNPETDTLTKLSNRRALDKQLGQSLQQLYCDDRHFVLALIDIDHFESINDAHGRQTGDRILRFIGNMLSVTLGENAPVARYEDDEFAVIVHSDDVDVVTAKLNRVRSRIAHDSRFSEDLEPTTISVGLAQAARKDSKSTIFERARKALAKAKDEGRDRTIVIRTADEPITVDV